MSFNANLIQYYSYNTREKKDIMGQIKDFMDQIKVRERQCWLTREYYFFIWHDTILSLLGRKKL